MFHGKLILEQNLRCIFDVVIGQERKSLVADIRIDEILSPALGDWSFT